MENNNNAFNKPPKNNKTKMFRFNLYWMYGIIFIMLAALYMTNDSSTTKEMGWTEFQKLANKNVFEKITVFNKKNTLEATIKKGQLAVVFKEDSALVGDSPMVFVKIPSADKFSDFYDKAVEKNNIDTSLSFEEGDDPFWNFFISFGPIIML